MVQVSWVLFLLPLASCSLQQSLFETGKDVQSVSLLLNKAIQENENVILVKRASPEQEVNLSSTIPIRTTQDILQDWDALEDSDIESRRAGKMRKILLQELIRKVHYDSTDKAGYVARIHSMLGGDRTEKYKTLINRNITESVPRPDRRDFPEIYLQVRTVCLSDEVNSYLFVYTRHLTVTPFFHVQTKYRERDLSSKLSRHHSHTQEGSSSHQYNLHSSAMQHDQFGIPFGQNREQQWSTHLALHDHQPTALHPPFDWPLQAPAQPSAEYHNDYAVSSDAEDLASMFHDEPPPQLPSYFRHD